MSTDASAEGSPERRPVACEYRPTCDGATVAAVDTAVPDSETQFVNACEDCVDEFADGPGNSPEDVLVLPANARTEVVR